MLEFNCQKDLVWTSCCFYSSGEFIQLYFLLLVKAATLPGSGEKGYWCIKINLHWYLNFGFLFLKQHCTNGRFWMGKMHVFYSDFHHDLRKLISQTTERDSFISPDLSWKRCLCQSSLQLWGKRAGCNCQSKAETGSMLPAESTFFLVSFGKTQQSSGKKQKKNPKNAAQSQTKQTT